MLTWLRQPPGEAKPGPLLRHLDRLTHLRTLQLPADLDRRVHQGRLAELAREGAQMSVEYLRNLEPERRYATMIALVLDTEATLTDQILEQHDLFMGRLFAEARRKHEQRFTDAGKAINDKVRLYSQVGHALVAARKEGTDPYAAIEAVLPWERYVASIREATERARPAAFDSLPLLVEAYGQVRRYAPRLLKTFDFRAAPVARDVVDGIEMLRSLYRKHKRTVPEEAPLAFLRKRWEPYVRTDAGIDRSLYEMAVLAELRNSLRSGDVWVPGSRQFKDFEDYLPPKHNSPPQLRRARQSCDCRPTAMNISMRASFCSRRNSSVSNTSRAPGSCPTSPSRMSYCRSLRTRQRCQRKRTSSRTTSLPYCPT